MKKVLMHMCCGPCSIYPIKSLKEQGYDIHGYFYNPNIHPYKEFKRRWETLAEYAKEEGIPLKGDLEYKLDEFLQGIVGREKSRCNFCYVTRLTRAAEEAKEGDFDCFTSTLLVSPYQNHELLKEMGEKIGREKGIPFLYEDFRVGYREATQISRDKEMYRQPYCGCIYSEKDRYYKGSK